MCTCRYVHCAIYMCIIWLPFLLQASSSIPDPFIIPTFRHTTEENLSKKILEDGDRKYIVQTVATLLMTHKQKPTLGECGKVATAVIKTYPFLADSDSSGEVWAIVHVYKYMYKFIILFLVAFLEVVYLQQGSQC